jgi:hypothetical protein
MPSLPRPRLPFPDIRAEDTTTVGPDERLWHIYRRGGAHPRAWDEFRDLGPFGNMRFDHHSPPRRRQGRAIFYSAVRRPRGIGVPALETCLAEAFQDGRTIDTSDRDPWVVEFTPVRPIYLLDVTSAWTTRAGGNQAICSGARPAARRWARAIYEDYPDVEGIHYAASTYGPGHCVALFERARDAIPVTPNLHQPLSHPGLRSTLDQIADLLGYGLV